jgi:hypothetical protein
MEGMLASKIGDYKRIDPRQFGNSSCRWRSLHEWTSCLSIIVWWLYIWSATITYTISYTRDWGRCKGYFD